MRYIALLLGAFVTLNSLFSVRAQSTAFTYQGRLNDGAQLANGIYDLQFTLHDAPADGAVLASPVTNSAVAVSKGLFTVTLDFGPSAFTGAERWLELAVCTNGAGAFVTLAPRQLLTPTPYAITASNLTGTLPASQLTGTLPSGLLGGTYGGAVNFNNPANTFSGNGAGLTQLDASQLAVGAVPDARLSANVALLNNNQTFSGAKTFSAAPSFAAAGAPFTVSSTTKVPNLNADLLDGLNSNAYAKQGGNALATALILGTTDNQPLDLRVNGQSGFRLEPSSGAPNVIGGADNNIAAAGIIGGAIGGGSINNIQPNSHHAAIGGGQNNTIQSNASFAIIGGGRLNAASAYAAAIGGGFSNTIHANANFAAIAGGWNNLVAHSAENASIGGGKSNTVASLFGTISGGNANTLQDGADWAAIGGGQNNMIQTNATHATVGGGYANTIQTGASYATIAGGRANTNEYDADYTAIGGGQFNTIQSQADYARIGGGYSNTIQTYVEYASIGGGRANTIQNEAHSAMIGGGQANTIQPVAVRATIAGGSQNTIRSNAFYATISGGDGNTIDAYAQHGAISGGRSNTIHTGGHFAAIPGGMDNAATNFAFAAGRRAKANHTGAFVWADSTAADFESKADNQFSVRAKGGVRLETGGAGATLDGRPLLTVDGNASQLTGLDASQLASGTVSDARLSANVALLDNVQTFSAAKTFSAAPGFTAAGAPFTVSNTNKVANLSADLLDGLDASAFALAAHHHDSSYAKQGGNALGVTLTLGTTDNQALELKVNGLRGLRLAPTADSSADTDSLPDGAPNVILGSPQNAINGGVVGATISGGGATNFNGSVRRNSVAADYATIGGGMDNEIGTSAQHATIAGGWNNSIQTDARHATIGGGLDNVIQPGATNGTIGGGRNNTIQTNSSYATIAGGWGNRIQSSAHRACIGGGSDNTIQPNGAYATISGGYFSTIQANASYATIGGGKDNTIQSNSLHATIGGGSANTIFPNAPYATIPGGQGNSATNYAFAAGHSAHAKHVGAFVWADATGSGLDSVAANSVTMRASGGYRLFSNPFSSAGVSLSAGGGSWTSMSDRNAKDNFTPVDAEAVLDKVMSLPLTTWNYKSQDAEIRHLGPMAQDFKAAFGLGETDTGITGVDADGVALAAIQGLNQKLEDKLQQKEREITELKETLSQLQELVRKLAAQQNGGAQ